jgi:hypothetical protein
MAGVSFAEIKLYIFLKLSPYASIAPEAARKTREAIKAYSMAVAPELSLKNARTIGITGLLEAKKAADCHLRPRSATADVFKT